MVNLLNFLMHITLLVDLSSYAYLNRPATRSIWLTRLATYDSGESHIPEIAKLNPGQIDVLKFLGKIDLQMDKETVQQLQRKIADTGDKDLLDTFREQFGKVSSELIRLTSVRVFEISLSGDGRYFGKEFMPAGYFYGKQELSVTRKLTAKFNSSLSIGNTSERACPFPTLIGYFRTDERIQSTEFQVAWANRFPRLSSPSKVNLFTVFYALWTRASLVFHKIGKSLACI